MCTYNIKIVKENSSGTKNQLALSYKNICLN